MKKTFYILGCCLLLVFSCFFVTACKGEPGDSGTPGKSAYEIAVEQGFEGTVEEWLESLKGKDGYNGLPGQDGEDGIDLTVSDLFNKAVEFGLYTNDAAGYTKFLSDYFSNNLNITDKVTQTTNKCLNQVVSVYIEDEEGEIALGAGVIYKIDRTKNEAYIITNYHVVSCKKIENVIVNEGQPDEFTTQKNVYYEAPVINLYLYGTESLKTLEDDSIDYGANAIAAEYIGGSANYDLAVLKVTGQSFEKIKNSSAQEISFADSDELQLGQTAIAIGNPMGGGTAVTKGIVNVDSENIILNIAGAGRQIRCIRTDAAVNGGNSGGGLFDINGHLIGIVNARKASFVDPITGELEMYNSVGYAIPANNVKNVVDNILDFYLLNYQEDAEDNTVGVHKYLIGITITIDNPRNIYDSTESINKLYEDVLITAVNENSIAKTIGVKVGDKVKSIKITRANGFEEEYFITRMHTLTDVMLTLRVGDTAEFCVIRENESSGNLEEIKLDSFTVSYENYAIYEGDAR